MLPLEWALERRLDEDALLVLERRREATCSSKPSSEGSESRLLS